LPPAGGRPIKGGQCLVDIQDVRRIAQDFTHEMSFARSPFLRGSIKIIGSVALLIYAILRTDFGRIRDMGALGCPLLLAAFGCALASFFFGVARWFILTRGIAAHSTFPRALQMSCRAQFLNTLLPTGYVGDMYKGVATADENADRITMTLTVILERGIGFVSLILLGAVVVIFSPSMNVPILRAVSVGLVVLIPFVIFLVPKLSARLTNRLETSRTKHLLDMFLRIFDPRRVSWATALSLLAALGTVFTYFFLAAAQHINVSFHDWALIVPVVTLFTFLPISWSGLGVREVTIMEAFRILGLNATWGFTTSLLCWALFIVLALACSFAWFWNPES
jgi:uncharacterized protein (TIRG00374 family)